MRRYCWSGSPARSAAPSSSLSTGKTSSLRRKDSSSPSGARRQIPKGREERLQFLTAVANSCVRSGYLKPGGTRREVTTGRASWGGTGKGKSPRKRLWDPLVEG